MERMVDLRFATRQDPLLQDAGFGPTGRSRVESATNQPTAFVDSAKQRDITRIYPVCGAERALPAARRSVLLSTLPVGLRIEVL